MRTLFFAALALTASPAIVQAQPVVRPTSVLEWDQPDTPMERAAAFIYEAEIDNGQVTQLAKQVCGNHATIPGTASCFLPFPSTQPGTHVLRLRATEPAEGGIGPWSEPFPFRVPSPPTAPTGLRTRVPGS